MPPIYIFSHQTCIIYALELVDNTSVDNFRLKLFHVKPLGF